MDVQSAQQFYALRVRQTSMLIHPCCLFSSLGLAQSRSANKAESFRPSEMFIRSNDQINSANFVDAEIMNFPLLLDELSTTLGYLARGVTVIHVALMSKHSLLTLRYVSGDSNASRRKVS